MTFTNRVGQDVLLKFSSEDEPKTLRVPDTRVSFVQCKTDRPNEIQVSVLLFLSMSSSFSRRIDVVRSFQEM